MASLKSVVKDYRDEIIDGIAWVAVWKDGRSWNASAFWPEGGDYDDGFVFSQEDYETMKSIFSADCKAICINGYYMPFGEDFTLEDIENKILYFYEARLNQLDGDFLECMVVPPKTYDLYENKGLSAAQLRAEYRGLTGLDNDSEFTDEEIYEYLLEALGEKEDPSVEELIAENEIREKVDDLLRGSGPEFPYMMLDRFRMDCEYYLGHGNRHVKDLWAENEREHIAYMKEMWRRLPEDGKPEWLPYEKILEYEAQMCGAPKVVCLSLKALFESLGPNLHFGGYIDVCIEDGKAYYDLRRDSDGMLLACDGEEFVLLGATSGTTRLGHKETGAVVWLSKEEADVAIFSTPELSSDVEKLIADAERSCEGVNNGSAMKTDIERGLE